MNENDYCSNRIANEPNDCVFLSDSEKRCCFDTNNKKCVWENSNNNLLCEEDFLYKFVNNGLEYKDKKGKNGYCIFNYNKTKGAVEYLFQNGKVKYKEKNGLYLECYNNVFFLNLNIYFILIIFFLIF